jgi:hypothetical protein
MKIRFLVRPKAQLVLSIAAIAAIVCSLFLFSLLDQVVHGDLYRYGLKFDYEWASQYWTYIWLARSLQVFVILTLAVSMGLTLTKPSTPKAQLITSPKKIFKLNSISPLHLILFLTGILSFGLSVLWNSSVIALIGLGLIFWGALLHYIRPGKYISQAFLDATTFSSLVNLNQLITELNYMGKAVYLPPKYLNDLTALKVYIGAKPGKESLPVKEIYGKEDVMLLKNPEGILITPPGMELANLFESKLGTNFTEVDLQYFEKNLPSLLVETLMIARNVEIKIENNQVYLKLEGSAYKDMCYRIRSLSKISANLGCPLCSALACLLAKGTGKLVAIEKEEQNENGEITLIQYALLEE